MDLLILVILSIVAIVCTKVFEKIDDYKNKINELAYELSKERSKRHIAEINNYAMRMQLNAMQKSSLYSSDSDVIAAVKYARRHMDVLSYLRERTGDKNERKRHIP